LRGADFNKSHLDQPPTGKASDTYGHTKVKKHAD